MAQHQERRKVLAGRGTKRTRRDSGQTTSESEADSDSDVVMRSLSIYILISDLVVFTGGGVLNWSFECM